MDDLAGLDWSKGSSSQKPTQGNYNLNPSFSSIKPTPPASGRVTPLTGNITSNPPSKPATPGPGADSFANLVSWSGGSNNGTLSLQEQQKRLADLKLQQQKQKDSTGFSGGDETFWNNLGSGRSTPAVDNQQNGKTKSQSPQAEEDDMFAVFNVPSQQPVSASVPKTKLNPTPTARQQAPPEDNDDDPFGLAEFKQREIRRSETVSTGATDDDDDVLGLLGKPVDSSRQKADRDKLPRPKPIASPADHPQDSAIAELVDMGFPANKARIALEQTDSGIDVQAAVSYLLNAAHEEARERSQSRNQGSNGSADVATRPSQGGRSQQPPVRPRSQLQDDEDSTTSRRRQRQPQADKEPTQMATEFGNNFLKTANSLWRQGQKRMQQAVQEFNSDSDSGGAPKWMQQVQRTQAPDDTNGRRRRRSSATKKNPADNVTDEAMMLETQRPTPPPRPARRKAEQPIEPGFDSSRDHSPAVPSRLRESAAPQSGPARQQQIRSPPPQVPAPRAALSRQANEDQAAQAYVSSARRRKAPTEAAAVSEPDLFAAIPKEPGPPRPSSSRPAQPPVKATPIAVRPPAPTRNIPSIPALSLKASHTARETGNAHFKRGDYSSAHTSYSSSLSHLPKGHPLTLVLLTNRSLTSLKTGDPKTAIIDCDTAITLVGISKGESETLDFLDGSSPRPMRDYYGKALMRKAEALEQMEKWSEAAAVWREAVEGNHGGATSMQGRLRAEKAANPSSTAARSASKPKAAAVANKPPPNHQPAAAQGHSAAVSALRAANAAADRADDERFALYDSVELKINNWKNGKQDNLRALLASLETVLWPEAQWKKISMADLVLPGKVKVQYMKGIGRVHPDKVRRICNT